MATAVVVDNRGVDRVLQQFFAQRHVPLIHRVNPGDALELLQQGKIPDWIISDVGNYTRGIDGIAFANIAPGLVGYDTKILLWSGHFVPGDRNSAIAQKLSGLYSEGKIDGYTTKIHTVHAGHSMTELLANPDFTIYAARHGMTVPKRILLH